MMWLEKRRHTLARLAAAIAALAVLLAIISRFIGATIVITQNSLMNFATISILFAIYFRLGTVAEAEKN